MLSFRLFNLKCWPPKFRLQDLGLLHRVNSHVTIKKYWLSCVFTMSISFVCLPKPGWPYLPFRYKIQILISASRNEFICKWLYTERMIQMHISFFSLEELTFLKSHFLHMCRYSHLCLHYIFFYMLSLVLTCSAIGKNYCTLDTYASNPKTAQLSIFHQLIHTPNNILIIWCFYWVYQPSSGVLHP
jgi:hypothetical protein